MTIFILFYLSFIIFTYVMIVWHDRDYIGGLWIEDLLGAILFPFFWLGILTLWVGGIYDRKRKHR